MKNLKKEKEDKTILSYLQDFSQNIPQWSACAILQKNLNQYQIQTTISSNKSNAEIKNLQILYKNKKIATLDKNGIKWKFFQKRKHEALLSFLIQSLLKNLEKQIIKTDKILNTTLEDIKKTKDSNIIFINFRKK